MQQYRRILVALALDELDATAVAYAGMLCRLARPERIYFTHVSRNLDAPAALRDQLPEVFQTPEDAAEQQMRQAVAGPFSGAAGCDIRFELSEGAPLKPILHALKRHDIDLAVLGRNPDRHAVGTLSERVARKAPCSVLIVPRGSRAELRTILVPVDFSPYSAHALQEGARLARAAGGARLICLHVYKVPIGYARSGKTYEQCAATMRHLAQEEYKTFIAALDLEGVPVESAFVLEERPEEAIVDAVETTGADLLLMGARGRTDSAAMMLGSITERCLMSTRIPLLAVKRKGDNMNVLDALLAL